ncbi:secreted antigen 1 [Babesia divergens]|uniref:Secreted antigen 1 n=1 Tax=Babesia divergens TaxID=32595 RepID=A0AAD9LII6_BABDI|nr:secreted antigen 1 [Babesia divergens]
MTKQEVTCDFKEPESLKDVLVELGKLDNATSTRHKVFQQLKESLQNFCGTAYLQAFYRSRDGGYGFIGTILLLTKAGQNVSEAIRQTTPWDGHLDREHRGHKDCALKIANALKKCLPKTFAALLFLLFNVSTECNQIGGGSWNTLKVNDSENSLGQWLIAGSGSDFIARKFLQGELNDSNKGQQVAEKLKNVVSLKPDTNEGALQKVLCGLMFVFPWDDALLGHACLFLHKFCDEVEKDARGNLQGRLSEVQPTISFENLKRVCGQLKGKLQPFVKGSDSAKLYAVSKMDDFDLFGKIWDENKFGEYVKWLKTRLDSIIKSLQTMSKDSSQWTDSKLKNASSAGPFKYGFVFKDKNWQDRINENLQGPINELTTPLNSLLQCLNGDSPANSERITTEPAKSSSGAAAAGAAGGLFGLGGAGAGVAYGLNLFGFKNLVTGLISSFLK